MRLAVVLGAGFSKAIDIAFPTADELGELVRERAPEAMATAPGRFSGGLFERWLSRIAEPQPDLSEAANLGNARDFQMVTEALHRVMVDLEGDVIAKRTPWWLLRLIGVLHLMRATVVTFNYDTLVEAAATRSFDHKVAQMLNTYSVTGGVPPTPPRSGMFGPSVTETFRLLKLHGSLDTYWVPNDATGATITRVADAMWVPNGGMNNPALNLAQQAPGRVPFIVPPASAKSALFANPITRQLWRTAAQGLAAAEQIAVVGYSAPLTDLVATAMLADAQRSGKAQIQIVNPEPDVVVDHLVRAGIPAESVHSAALSCEEYVDQLEEALAVEAARALAGGYERDLPVCVAADLGRLRPLWSAQAGPAGVAVEAGDPETRQEGLDTSAWMKLGALLDQMDRARGRPVSQTRNGERALVIDHYLWPAQGAPNAFIVLVPSANRIWNE